MKKWIIIIIIAVIAGAFAMARLLMPGDRQRIMAAVATGRAAMEREDADKVMSIVSLGYRDEYGFTYMTLRKTCADMFARLDNISVGCAVGEVVIRGDTAEAALDVSLTATSGGDRVGIIGGRGPERLTVRFEKSGVAWKAVGSRWETFSPVEAFFGGAYPGVVH